jgi:hypothetical protein
MSIENKEMDENIRKTLQILKEFAVEKVANLTSTVTGRIEKRPGFE